jgi:hypothetical protein
VITFGFRQLTESARIDVRIPGEPSEEPHAEPAARASAVSPDEPSAEPSEE